MLGNGFVIDLYTTGISRLFRAPETARMNKKVSCMHVQAFIRKGKIELFNLTKLYITGTEAESKLGLEVTGVAVKVFIRNHHHHPLTPAQMVTCYSCYKM